MSEKFKGEKAYSPEGNESIKEEVVLYKKLQAVMAEKDRIMAEIDKVFESTPDRDEAEKIILEKLAPLMDELVKESSKLTKQWLETMRVSQ